MSNRVSVNIINMTYYNEKLEVYCSGWGYHVSDDYNHDWDDTWESSKKFMNHLTSYDESPHVAIVKLIVKEGSENARETLMDNLDIGNGIYIFDKLYESSEVEEWISSSLEE